MFHAISLPCANAISCRQSGLRSKQNRTRHGPDRPSPLPLAAVPARLQSARDREGARRSPPTWSILDLEDAVRDEDKAAAREAAVAATRRGLRRRARSRSGSIRPAARHYGEDVVAVRHSSADFDRPRQGGERQAGARRRLADGQAGAGDDRDARARVLDAAAIAPATRRADRRHQRSRRRPRPAGPAGPAGPRLRAAADRARRPRRPGSPPSTASTTGSRRTRGSPRECAEGRAFGFDGKSVIHPEPDRGRQPRLRARARRRSRPRERLIAAATGGAERHEGRMIEALHVDAGAGACSPRRGASRESLASARAALLKQRHVHASSAPPRRSPSSRRQPLAAQADPPVTPADLLRHIEVLASDEFQGRAPGHRGRAADHRLYRRAARARAALEPAGENGSWFQPVRLVERSAGRQPGCAGPRTAARSTFGRTQIVLLGRDARETHRRRAGRSSPATARACPSAASTSSPAPISAARSC